MSKLSPRPDWPDDKEPINGGLLYICLVGAGVLLALLAGAVWGLGVVLGAW